MEGHHGHHSLGDPPAQFPQPQDAGSGSWAAGDVGSWVWVDDLLEFGNDDSLIQGGPAEDLLVYPLGTNKDSSSSSSGVNHHVEADAADPLAMSYYLVSVARGGHASSEQSPVGGADQPPPPPVAPADTTIQAWFDNSLEPAAANEELTTAEPDDDEMEVAEMVVRVAARCGEDEARTVWSEQEQQELLHRLHLYTEEDDAVIRCFKIAFHLPNKTALDVALRCRWLQEKMKTAGNAGLTHKDDTACGKLVNKKVKRTKMAKKTNNKIYPLSKEALKSKSTKELIRDNNMFLKRIEENLKTGQLANTADYFYYVKTNMDAIKERPSKYGISIDMPPIDEQGLEEILRSRLNSLALTEDRTPKTS